MIDFHTLKESSSTELKSSHQGLSKDVYETYSAFANTEGGTIYLGIKEIKPGQNEIIGVLDAEKQIDDLFNTLENETKVSANILKKDDIESFEYEGKTLIRIVVPECNRTAKPIFLNGNEALCYIRGNKGDYLASDEQRRSFLIDNAIMPYDLKPNPLDYDFSDIDLQTLKLFRKRVDEAFPNHRGKNLQDEDFMKTNGCFAKKADGREVLTIAATLLFTDFYRIRAIFPHYYVEYREATSFESKWLDRLSADMPNLPGNLYSIYEDIYQRLLRMAPKPYLQRNGIDTGGAIFEDALRELLSNAISNCAFSLDGGVKILANKDFVFVQNAGRLKVGLEQAKKGGISKPRNGGIMTLLRIAGRADRAGTGIPNILSLASSLRLITPMLSELSEPEQTMMTFYFNKRKEDSPRKQDIKESIYSLILSKGAEGISVAELENITQYDYSSLYRYIKELKEEGRVSDNGRKTNGKKFFAI